MEEIKSILKHHRLSQKKNDANNGTDRFLGRAWTQIDSFSAENFMKIVDTSKLLPLGVKPDVNLIYLQP